jgi:hypothetical protein
VTDDHERNLELLSGYALLGLGGSDAEEADRLLSEHLPTCFTCRMALADFRGLAGDLALVAPAVEPPDLVLARIRRGIRDVPVRRRRGAGVAALAVSVAALVGMAGFSLSLGGRATRAEAQRGTALAVLNAMRQPGASAIALEGDTGPASGALVEVAGPSLEQVYLYGDDVPQPAPGAAYQVWVGAEGTYTPVGEPVVPESGLVLLEVTVDTARYDELLVTEEPLGVAPTSPSLDGGHVWRAAL